MAQLILLRGTSGSGKSEIAARVSALRSDIRVIEVDDIKLRKYGTTESCKPWEDFPEAGQRAQAFLDQGYHTVVVEAFIEKAFLSLVLAETGRTLSSTNVTIV